MTALMEVITKFNGIMDLHREAERKVVVLMAHPDVTAEQLVQANKSCVATANALTGAVTKLREKYPANKSVVTLPWSIPELDKYDERLTNVR